MACSHDGYHTFCTVYDRQHGELVHFWVCEGCKSKLDEAGRQNYRPHHDPHGNDRYLHGASAAAG